MSAFRATADSTINVDKISFCPAVFRVAAIEPFRDRAAFHDNAIARSVAGQGMPAFRAATDSTIDGDKVFLCPAVFRVAAIDAARNRTVSFNPDRVAGNTARNSLGPFGALCAGTASGYRSAIDTSADRAFSGKNNGIFFGGNSGF